MLSVCLHPGVTMCDTPWCQNMCHSPLYAMKTEVCLDSSSGRSSDGQCALVQKYARASAVTVKQNLMLTVRLGMQGLQLLYLYLGSLIMNAIANSAPLKSLANVAKIGVIWHFTGQTSAQHPKRSACLPILSVLLLPFQTLLSCLLHIRHTRR